MPGPPCRQSRGMPPWPTLRYQPRPPGTSIIPSRIFMLSPLQPAAAGPLLGGDLAGRFRRDFLDEYPSRLRQALRMLQLQVDEISETDQQPDAIDQARQGGRVAELGDEAENAQTTGSQERGHESRDPEHRDDS